MATPKKTTSSKATAKKSTAKAAAKVATAKKTAVKKVVATKKTAAAVKAKAPKVVPTVTKKDSSSNGGIVFLVVVLAGLVIGLLSWIFLGQSTSTEVSADSKVLRLNEQTYVSVKNIEQNFMVELTKDQSLAVYGGQTWIPVPGNPVEVVVLSDENCNTCAPEQGLSVIRQNITPALITRVVDVTSTEGKQLIEDFEVLKIPAYFLGEGATELKAPTGEELLPLLGNILTSKDDLHYFGAQSGLPSSKFIKAPAIDIAGEPQLGNGPVKVIEFTDYQCPYCKRLHDQNKDLIQEMVDNGTITYVLKDFPLAFHPQAMNTHAALNCAQKDAGNDAYFALKADIFRDQAVWGKMTGAPLDEYLVNLASEQGADIASCITDPAVAAEIQADMAEGSKYGVSGTPGLFVGAQFIPGAIGSDQMRQAIESEK